MLSACVWELVRERLKKSSTLRVVLDFTKVAEWWVTEVECITLCTKARATVRGGGSGVLTFCKPRANTSSTRMEIVSHYIRALGFTA